MASKDDSQPVSLDDTLIDSNTTLDHTLSSPLIHFRLPGFGIIPPVPDTEPPLTSGVPSSPAAGPSTLRKCKKCLKGVNPTPGAAVKCLICSGLYHFVCVSKTVAGASQFTSYVADSFIRESTTTKLPFIFCCEQCRRKISQTDTLIISDQLDRDDMSTKLDAATNEIALLKETNANLIKTINDLKSTQSTSASTNTTQYRRLQLRVTELEAELKRAQTKRARTESKSIDLDDLAARLRPTIGSDLVDVKKDLASLTLLVQSLA